MSEYAVRPWIGGRGARKRIAARPVSRGLVAIFVSLWGPLVLAQTPIPGNYAPNAVNGMKAAIVPPPSTVVLENGSLFYHTRKFVDSSGNEIRTSTTNAYANRTILGYVPDFTILGANYNPSVVLIFANQLVRPVPGSKKDLQLADMVFQPFSAGLAFRRMARERQL